MGIRSKLVILPWVRGGFNSTIGRMEKLGCPVWEMWAFSPSCSIFVDFILFSFFDRSWEGKHGRPQAELYLLHSSVLRWKIETVLSVKLLLFGMSLWIRFEHSPYFSMNRAVFFMYRAVWLCKVNSIKSICSCLLICGSWYFSFPSLSWTL